MRVFAYIRVSRERDGMISPEIQRDEISRFCESRGWQMLEWFTDLDLSGKLPPEKRPALQELLLRAQAGECDTVVVYRIDRLSREPADYYAIMALLRKAGIGVDAATQPKDDSPEGDFLWDLNAVLARYESLKLGARLRDMHSRLRREGRYVGGPPPFGWRRERDGGGRSRLVLVPEEAEHRRRIHEWYQRGWSLSRIARELNHSGVTGRNGATWSATTVANALEAPCQVGARNNDGELVIAGHIEPLLDEETYRRTLALRELRKRADFRSGREPKVALAGNLVRCGNCGNRMYLHYSFTERVTYYHCEGRRLGTCDHGAAIRETVLRGEVERRLLAHLKRLRGSERPSRPPEAITPYLETERRLEGSLARLAAMYAEGSLPEDEYRRARDLQRQKLEQVRTRISAVAGRLGPEVSSDDQAALTALTPELWALLPVQAQRDIYRLLMEWVVVNPRPREPRIHVRWR